MSILIAGLSRECNSLTGVCAAGRHFSELPQALIHFLFMIFGRIKNSMGKGWTF